MNNHDKYHFKDFTETNYRKLIRLAKKKFKFTTYQDYQKEKNFILWRHDVDYSVNRARKIALIDKEEGIKSTFFFLLHSEFYNLLEKEITDLALEIVLMGHEIGIHFDMHYYGNLDEKKLNECLKFEKKIYENIFRKKIKVFSFHNPTPQIFKWDKKTYQGMINVYNPHLQKKTGYVSDSNGYWRVDRLEDILLNSRFENLQVLTHPEWWQGKIMSPFERVKRSVEGRAEKNIKKYLAHLKKYKRNNIDW